MGQTKTAKPLPAFANRGFYILITIYYPHIGVPVAAGSMCMGKYGIISRDCQALDAVQSPRSTPAPLSPPSCTPHTPPHAPVADPACPIPGRRRRGRVDLLIGDSPCIYISTRMRFVRKRDYGVLEPPRKVRVRDEACRGLVYEGEAGRRTDSISFQLFCEKFLRFDLEGLRQFSDVQGRYVSLSPFDSTNIRSV